ncbi:helix-turn-helix domain-containing protein [Neobacillus niacini]|uniref:PucR family transcriptional regulator n=1 Tax=Neobacillus niacini TaxID=86668 RepID=UPI0028618008|nr:helix-turn-helix domain-containing protein [Neobacillus niacini]MDR6997829.1 sugar diacid utilization regulator [Neobacillus niacini]
MTQIGRNEQYLVHHNQLKHIRTLHELVELVSGLVENPVTIEAPNFDLMAYSGNYQILDPARRNTILGKKVPNEIVDYLKESGIVHSIEKTNAPVRVPTDENIGLTNRVAMCIKDKDKILGYIWVQETDRKLTKKELLFLKDIAKKAADIILENNQTRNIELDSRKQFFSKLLQSHYTNERVAKLEAELAGIMLPTIYSTLVLYLEEGQINDHVRSLIRTLCLYTSKTTYWIENENHIVIIIGSPSVIDGSSTKLAKEFVDNFNKRMEDVQTVKLNIGIGKEYNQLLTMHKSYLEAMEVINIRKQFKNCAPIFYQDLGIYRILSTIHDKYMQENYINENIKKLEKYDQENQTELLLTLEKYLKCNSKVKETAETLFIHPNTLNYRLKRIFDLCQLKMDDMNERTSLYIDLLLLQYKKQK